MLPARLQEDNVDVLILSADDDIGWAKKLEEGVNVMTFDIAGTIHHGKAVQLNDAVVFERSKVDQLDEALKYSTIACAIITPSFQNKEEYRQTGNATFWNTIQNLNKKHCFLPVFVAQKSVIEEMPVHFRQLVGIDMSAPDEQWKKDLQKRIQLFFHDRLRRDINQRRAGLEHLRLMSMEEGFCSPYELSLLAGLSSSDVCRSEEYKETSLDEGFQSKSMQSDVFDTEEDFQSKSMRHHLCDDVKSVFRNDVCDGLESVVGIKVADTTDSTKNMQSLPIQTSEATNHHHPKEIANDPRLPGQCSSSVLFIGMGVLIAAVAFGGYRYIHLDV